MAQRMTQEMAELPKIRLTPYEPPFTYSGVDYFAPFYVKRKRGKVAEKRWGAIFVYEFPSCTPGSCQVTGNG